jgi:hypothetical protein
VVSYIGTASTKSGLAAGAEGIVILAARAVRVVVSVVGAEGIIILAARAVRVVVSVAGAERVVVITAR